MTKCTNPMEIAELIERVDTQLQTLSYSEESVRHYRNVWNNLRRYADEHGIHAYSMTVGREFVRDHYGFIIEEPCPRTSFQRTIIRAVEVLADYQAHGIIFRRRFTKDDTYPPQFEKVFNGYYASCEAKGLAAGTLRQISIHSRKFAKYLDHKGILYFSEITASDIQGFVLTMAPFARHTVAYAMYVLSGLMVFAHENGYHQEDLSSACPKVRYNSKSAIPSAFSEGEVKKLLAVVDRGNPLGKRDYAILMLAAHLGIRAGEIRNLQFEHMKWETSRIEFIQPKTQKLLSLSLLPDVGWAVIEYIRYGRPPQSMSKHIFVRHNAPFDAFGENDNLHNIMTKYLRQAGITVPQGKRYGLHSLRHSLASTLLANNIPMPVISEIMNHANTETTNIYYKIDFSHLKECALDVDFGEEAQIGE